MLNGVHVLLNGRGNPPAVRFLPNCGARRDALNQRAVHGQTSPRYKWRPDKAERGMQQEDVRGSRAGNSQAGQIRRVPFGGISTPGSAA